MGQLFLGESQSRLYLRAKFWRGPMAVSKKVSFKFISRWSFTMGPKLHMNDRLHILQKKSVRIIT